MTEKIIKKLPNHVAIIPDGNRRWAKKRGLPAWEGHEAGAQNLEKLIKFSAQKGIYCLSFWGSSLDNLKKRPLEEKRAMLKIYEKYFSRLIENKDIAEKEVRVNFIGRWQEQFPDSLKKIINQVIQKTQNYQKRILNFFLAYNGTDEMVRAISQIAEKYNSQKEITAAIIKDNLMTREIPAVDLIIRTGGEPHLSAGFMMWDAADAQLYFSNEYYPDFNEEKFDAALQDYARRQRRFGG
ncbi:di-trans,poly-cis-decaprenylcistransferase [Patescibacteria group bacterium]|nr:di-trans,poly-cis-decaprenylcistransferase [Patescibacteria group bacterium]